MIDIDIKPFYTQSTDPADRSLVISNIATDFISFTVPFNRFGILPLGGRTNLLILRNATIPGIFITPSHAYTEATRKSIAAIIQETGLQVKWLVTPSGDHGIYIDQWVKAFPEALPIGTTRWGEVKKHIKWAGIYGNDKTVDTFGFESEVSIHAVPAHKNQELAIIHHPSRSLLTADLIFNLPGTVQYSRNTSTPILARLLGIPHKLNPKGSMHKSVLNGNLTPGAPLKAQLAGILGEDFDRIVPCHGGVIEENGKEVFRGVFKEFV